MLSGIADILFALAGLLMLYIMWGLERRIYILENRGRLVYKPEECNNATEQVAQQPTPKA